MGRARALSCGCQTDDLGCPTARSPCGDRLSPLTGAQPRRWPFGLRRISRGSSGGCVCSPDGYGQLLCGGAAGISQYGFGGEVKGFGECLVLVGVSFANDSLWLPAESGCCGCDAAGVVRDAVQTPRMWLARFEVVDGGGEDVQRVRAVEKGWAAMEVEDDEVPGGHVGAGRVLGRGKVAVRALHDQHDVVGT